MSAKKPEKICVLPVLSAQSVCQKVQTGLLQGSQDFLYLHFKYRQIILHYFPNNFGVGFKIAMRQNMPHANHAAPGYFGVLLTQRM